MNKRQAMLWVLDYFIADIRSTDAPGFYEDETTGELVSERDQKRLDEAREILSDQLSRKYHRLTKRETP